MTSSTRFVVAFHILTLVAYLEDESVTSQVAAGSANTNPVVIRRIASALAKAGLVTTQPGAAGGTRLTRRPERINLLEVYRAVEASEFFALHSQPPNEDCVVGRSISGSRASRQENDRHRYQHHGRLKIGVNKKPRRSNAPGLWFVWRKEQPR